VVDPVHQLVEARQHLVERARLVHAVDAEGGHAADRHGRDHPERAEAHARCPQVVLIAHLHQLAGAVHDPHAHHLGGQVAEASAGAVRGGAHGAGEGLAVHVSLVLEREPARRELLAQIVQRDAGLDGHVGTVDGQDAAHLREVHQHAVRAGDVGERVPRADRPEPASPPHHARELVLVARALDPLGRAALLARPVGPGLRHGATYSRAVSEDRDAS
jgi:hypothetical protein